MPRDKRTIARDSVLRPLASQPLVAPQPARRVAPTELMDDETPLASGAARQTGVWLTDGEIEWLDDSCRDTSVEAGGGA